MYRYRSLSGITFDLIDGRDQSQDLTSCKLQHLQCRSLPRVLSGANQQQCLQQCYYCLLFFFVFVAICDTKAEKTKLYKPYCWRPPNLTIARTYALHKKSLSFFNVASCNNDCEYHDSQKICKDVTQTNSVKEK